MQVTVEREAATIWVASSFADRDLIRQVPGAKFDRAREQWHLPLSWPACLQLRAVFGERLEVRPSLREWASVESEGRVRPCSDLRQEAQTVQSCISGGGGYFEQPESEHAAWFVQQQAVVRFLATAGSSVLTTPRGSTRPLARIVTALAAVSELQREAENPYPVLIVSADGKLDGWAEHLARRRPDRATVMLRGSPRQRTRLIGGDWDFALISYECLRAHTRLAPYGSLRLSDRDRRPAALNLVRPATVIADECLRATHPQAQLTRALWALGQQAQHRFALTDGDVWETPDTLWAVLHFAAAYEFPSRVAFLDRYATMDEGLFGDLIVTGFREDRIGELLAVTAPRLIEL